jgi:transposase
VIVCLDEMGPESAKSYRGQELVREPDGEGPVERAKQEIDYGRRGKGYVFGAFKPADGEAFTEPYGRRTAANFADFLEKVDDWIGPDVEQVYAILDSLAAHRASDVLLFSLGHPRWEFVFQPKYAAYMNLIEPWWKVLRSLALKGRRFETWAELCEAVKTATAYWNGHRHPFIWGRSRRHKARRASGIALVPKVA